MNGYKFAEDNPIFKDSVQVAVENLLGAGYEPEEITNSSISPRRIFEIKADWHVLLTENDMAEIRTHIAEDEHDEEHLDKAMKAEFDRVFENELEHQIRRACENRSARERGE